MQLAPMATRNLSVTKIECAGEAAASLGRRNVKLGMIAQQNGFATERRIRARASRRREDGGRVGYGWRAREGLRHCSRGRISPTCNGDGQVPVTATESKSFWKASSLSALSSCTCKVGLTVVEEGLGRRLVGGCFG
ncbi:hypothetical protein KC19_11G040000 [Ceratodon purpureus]|uniref:Uncharacterized protein n=1 Tax=Ceratodon purpureus TaxID=3225 RepID=A0A8T0GDU0_CERPU|nr:hypothetical protein KC19_11G040000 [Ceratodon purpureus]